MWKEWMLKFYWETTGTNETFYFDTKEQMIKFSKMPEIRVEGMWHLEKVEME